MADITTLRLIVPVRGRERDLERLLAWWLRNRRLNVSGGIRLTIVEYGHKAHCRLVLACPDVDYIHCPGRGAFRKTRCLNLALARHTDEFVMPFDVDLVPSSGTLLRHFSLAVQLQTCLLTGYRLMVASEKDIPAGRMRVAAEDKSRVVRKQLVHGERFGVCPIFRSAPLRRIGGWDERFVGWGAEDQDIIARYLAATNGSLLRAPDLIYFHFDHEPDANWAEPKFIARNRIRYYQRHAASPPTID